MSGITGLWNLDEQDADPGILDFMAAALAHRGGDAYGLRLHGAAGLACHLFRVTPESAAEEQPAHRGVVSLVFDGRLDNREELLPVLQVAQDSPDSALVLAAYAHFGDSFAERLAGDFSFGLFDSRQQQLVLGRDALGIRPLYYAEAGRTFLFASEIAAILAHPRMPRRPDEDALADFFLGTRDQFRRGRTFFAGIRTVRPGEIAVVKTSGVKFLTHWNFDPTKRLRLRNFGEYAEAFRHHFEIAVRRRIRSAYPVAVALSGGVDSSAIFCTAESLRARSGGLCPQLVGSAMVFDHGPADERNFLNDIQQQYGSTIVRLPTTVGECLEGGRDFIRHVEAPFFNLHWKTWDRMLGAAQQQGARVLLNGEWGDQILFDQAYLVDLFRCGAWKTVLAHLREFPRWFDDAEPGVFNRFFRSNLVRYNIPESFLERLRKWRNAGKLPADRPWFTDVLRNRARKLAYLTARPASRHATAHAQSLYEDARSGYHYLILERSNKVAARQKLETAFPYLDRDLVAFLMSIPGEIQTCDGIPKGLLRRSLQGLVPPSILDRRWKGDPTVLYNEGMSREFPKISRYLDKHHESARMGYLNAGEVREGLRSLEGRIKGDLSLVAWSIRDILALELWSEAFFASPRTEEYDTENKRD